MIGNGAVLDPRVGFPLFLLLTIATLAAVVVTGMRARVRLHIALVATAVALLGVAIYFAEKLGALYDLEAAGAITPIHLAIAKVATASYLLPIVSGIMTLRDRRHRAMHFKLAMFVLAMTVLTAITGSWMLFVAPAAKP